MTLRFDAVQMPLPALARWLDEHLPTVADTLNPGASEDRLDRLQAHTGLDLPQDYRALYRWHDGQQRRDGVAGLWYGLHFPSLDDVEACWASWLGFADDPWSELDELAVSLEPGVVRPRYASRGWIPFGVDGRNCLGVDLDPDVHGVRGQVINFGLDQDLKRAWMPDLSSFVRWFVAQLQRSRFPIALRADGRRDFNTLNLGGAPLLSAMEYLLHA